MSSDEVPFNKQLRLATREIHSVSDALVNAKLAFALSSNKVWAEGLLVFYEIFRFLEEAMVRHQNEPLGKMYISGILRTEAFEKDLAFYLGEDWKKTYVIRPAVAKYLSHLQSIEKEDPTMLAAYVYHLYMGLLSGGQILKRKRALAKKIFFSSPAPCDGEHVTDFKTENIYNLKCSIIKNINSLAETLNESEKEKLLSESKNVFLLNNEIVQTIEGSKEVLIKKLFLFLLFILVLLFIYYVLFS